MTFYGPSRGSHGAYWYDWTTTDEVAWRHFYQVWFTLVNDYKKMGGRVTTGSDAAFCAGLALSDTGNSACTR